MRRLFTSESVSDGHPDKVCDQIADAILDETLKQDRYARVACEVACNNKGIYIMGQRTSTTKIDEKAIARNVLMDIGYCTEGKWNYGNRCKIKVDMEEQSPDIAMGIEGGTTKRHGEIGAGDQGIMFGYACNDTKELMPLPIMLAHDITKRLGFIRTAGLDGEILGPDAKAQVTVLYEDDIPLEITTILVSTQHTEDAKKKDIWEVLVEDVIDKVIPEKYITERTQLIVNPTGRFVKGGPEADTGLTGRKLIVDTYGGAARHGGGAFSGKDATKVDRSAAYMARYAAKNVVAAGLAKKCEIQVAYAIGRSLPVSISVDTLGTGKVPDDVISRIVSNTFSFQPADMIRQLNLRAPIYRDLSNYGHMGREDLCVLWENVDKVDELMYRLPKN